MMTYEPLTTSHGMDAALFVIGLGAIVLFLHFTVEVRR